MKKFSEKVLQEIKEVRKNYHTDRSATMSAMQIVQKERGHLSRDDMATIAEMLGVEPVIVHEVGAFYTMYNVDRPVGRYHVQVCRNISCSLMGAEHIIETLEKKLNIKTGETTVDKRFTLSTVECLGSCGTAPMMQVNDDYHEDLTDDKVAKILSELK
ncbi:MAG: NADH-quinone oxidoreductase subunit NuoE [Deltaproteobacteria bacterium]|nr:NADH-quinone oxidoreductase subunit NuoE [Deltaproteobacteria bacterium]